jgi:hypothetical protein
MRADPQSCLGWDVLPENLLSQTYFNSHGNSIAFFLSWLGGEIAFPRLPTSVCHAVAAVHTS